MRFIVFAQQVKRMTRPKKDAIDLTESAIGRLKHLLSLRQKVFFFHLKCNIYNIYTYIIKEMNILHLLNIMYS